FAFETESAVRAAIIDIEPASKERPPVNGAGAAARADAVENGLKRWHVGATYSIWKAENMGVLRGAAALIAGHPLRHGRKKHGTPLAQPISVRAGPGNDEHQQDHRDRRDYRLRHVQVLLPEIQPPAIHQLDMHPINQQRR